MYRNDYYKEYQMEHDYTEELQALRGAYQKAVDDMTTKQEDMLHHLVSGLQVFIDNYKTRHEVKEKLDILSVKLQNEDCEDDEDCDGCYC